MSTVANETFTLGETWTVDFTFKDGNGAPLDLTGASAIRWRLKNRATGAVLDLGIGTGVAVASDPTTGVATANVTPAIQAGAGLVASVYDHEARVTLADGAVTTQVTGAITVVGSLFNASVSTLIVEDGTGLANADSYLSVAEADAYHAAMGNADWIGDDATKDRFLRRATAFMERRYGARWKGFRAHVDRQAFSWPRSDVFVDYGDGGFDQGVNVVGDVWRVYRSGLYTVPSDIVPAAVKNATAEVALALLQGVRLETHPSQPAPVRRKSVRAGSVAVDTSYADTSNTITQFAAVDGLLYTLLKASSPFFAMAARV